MDDQSRYTSTGGTAPAAPRQRLLTSLRDTLAKWSGVHLKGFLDKLDQELFRLADRADNNADQSRYWQTRAELVSHRVLIERRMSDRLRDAFQAFIDRRDTWHTERDGSAAESDEMALELMEEEHLERNLAVDNMSRRASADCSEVLYTLHQRLSVLAVGQKVTEQGNPVAPRIFVEALDTGLVGLAIDNRARLLIYKFYEGLLMERLGKLYELLNHQLKSEGVLPNLRHTIVRQADAVATRGGSDSVSLQNQHQLMRLIIQQLQAGFASGSADHGARIDAVGLIGDMQLLGALAGLQRTGAAELMTARAPDQVEAASALLQHRVQEQVRKAADSDSIEIVGLLFNYMLNDDQLPDSVKALLSCLHTPFLRLALSDQELFNSPQHPARQLLNCLTAAGERWVEPEGKRRSEVFQQMHRTVARALDEFDDDVRLFSELLAEFNRFLEQHAQRVQRAEHRAREIARGEDRLKESRQQVQQFLNRRCAGVPLTEAARELLFGPWAHYQAFVWLRFGTDSDVWEESADAVDALIHYLGPGTRRNENHERLLLAGLRGGLEMVGYDRAKADALFAALADSRDSKALAKPLKVPEPPPLAGSPELVRLSAMEFGTWFLFGADLPRKQQQQLKLAWYNLRTLRFMFVNRLGQQVVVRQGVELAEDMRAGRTRVLGGLDAKPFFEAALERIAEQLKGNSPALTGARHE